MKKLLRLLVAATALVPILITAVKAEKRESIAVSKTAQAIDFTQSTDISGWDGVSAQAVYSDGTPATVQTISGGSRSAGTIRVENYQSLIAQKAQVQIRISSNAASALTGASISINGTAYRQGIEWNIGTSTLITAQNICTAINKNSGLTSTHTLNTAALITASATVVGSFFNSYTVTSSTPTALVVSSPTLTGGQDNAVISFPTLGITLTQGTDFSANTSTAQTALNISTAINANVNLSALVVTTRTTNVSLWSTIWASATANGFNNYPISVSTPSALVVSGFGLSGGASTDISTSTYQIAKINHFFTTGMAVLFSTAGALTPPGNLTNQTTYYVIVVDTNTFKLATSTTNAFAGTNIFLTTLPQAFSTYSITACPLTTVAGDGFFWSVSNDNTNFTNFTSATVSSVTYTAAGNSVWDFGRINYKYLKVTFSQPTRGGIALNIKLFGRKD